MPSSWSTSLRFELQFPGESVNLWGDKLNVNFEHVDYTVAGWLTKALSAASTTLTTANAGDDEARAAMLKFTGTGTFTVVIPPVSKSYKIWNACTGAVTITTGAGATVSIDPDDVVLVICDGSNVKTLSYGGLSIKDYIAAVALGTTGELPAQLGNAGKFIKTDGENATWEQPASTDLADYESAIVEAQVANAFAAALALGRR